MGVTVDQQVEIGGSFELLLRRRAQPATFIPRAVIPAGIRATLRKSACPIGMQLSERSDCPLVSHNGANHSVAAVLLVAQSVTVLDAQAPAGDSAFPRSDAVIDTDIFTKDLSTPAIVVAGDPENVDAGVAQLGQRSEGAKAATGDDGFPLEPEVEQIPVDDQRLRFAGETAEKRNEGSFDLWTGDANVRVRNDIAGRVEHGTSY